MNSVMVNLAGGENYSWGEHLSLEWVHSFREPHYRLSRMSRVKRVVLAEKHKQCRKRMAQEALSGQIVNRRIIPGRRKDCEYMYSKGFCTDWLPVLQQYSPIHGKTHTVISTLRVVELTDSLFYYPIPLYFRWKVKFPVKQRTLWSRKVHHRTNRNTKLV